MKIVRNRVLDGHLSQRFLSHFDPRSLIVQSVFDCRLSSLTMADIVREVIDRSAHMRSPNTALTLYLSMDSSVRFDAIKLGLSIHCIG